ncbi:leucyl/phenylalanyl-tRNA--protein transferase [Pseudophaeobacter sp.]|uniref:leucyl/phenylalanyl-tRNA--protein transferase n=1 Tax=Pseudophaeobacter sp. TaxID=1971739 RepID=UPI0040583657
MSLTPDLLLHAYSVGVFPMAEHREDEEIFWVDPKRRGIFPIKDFHISRSLAKTLRQDRFEISVNRAFAEVVEACADRAETWINGEIFARYQDLHAMGHAHSLEVWQQGQLAGGVYGVSLGAVFFGESMFSRHRDASKVALAYLMDRLRQARFQLCDTQFLTPHLASLGAVEISRAAYKARLQVAIKGEADFDSPAIPGAQMLLQRMTQTS